MMHAVTNRLLRLSEGGESDDRSSLFKCLNCSKGNVNLESVSGQHIASANEPK